MNAKQSEGKQMQKTAKGSTDGAVRSAVHKAGAAAGRVIEQAGARVEQAGEKVGEAALNVGVRVEEVGHRLKEAGKKLSHS